MRCATCTEKPVAAAEQMPENSHVVVDISPMDAEAFAPRLPTMEASMYCMAMDDSCAMMAGPLSRAVSRSCCPHVSFCPSRMSDRRKSVLPLFCSIQFCTLVSGVQR